MGRQRTGATDARRRGGETDGIRVMAMLFSIHPASQDILMLQAARGRTLSARPLVASSLNPRPVPEGCARGVVTGLLQQGQHVLRLDVGL